MRKIRISIIVLCLLSLLTSCRSAKTNMLSFVSENASVTSKSFSIQENATDKTANDAYKATTQGNRTITTLTETVNTTYSPYKKGYFANWEEYRKALSGVQTSKDLGNLFSNNDRRVAMPMFLEERFLVLPASKEHFRESCMLESQGYTMFLFVSEEKCSATVEIAHHKELFSQHDSSWHREEPYTTDSGLEITAYTTEPSRKMYYTTVYGYPVRIDTYNACTCIEDFVNTLTFEKVEIK